MNLQEELVRLERRNEAMRTALRMNAAVAEAAISEHDEEDELVGATKRYLAALRASDRPQHAKEAELVDMLHDAEVHELEALIVVYGALQETANNSFMAGRTAGLQERR